MRTCSACGEGYSGDDERPNQPFRPIQEPCPRCAGQDEAEALRTAYNMPRGNSMWAGESPMASFVDGCRSARQRLRGRLERLREVEDELSEFRDHFERVRDRVYGQGFGDGYEAGRRAARES